MKEIIMIQTIKCAIRMYKQNTLLVPRPLMEKIRSLMDSKGVIEREVNQHYFIIPKPTPNQ